MRCRASDRLILIAVIVSAVATATASAEERLIDVERSSVTVHVSKSGLFRAFADDHVVQAPLSEGSFDDTVPHAQVVIDARRLHVLDPGLSAKDRLEVQTRMLGSDVLDVDRFTRISFHTLDAKRLDAREWIVRGELELHGEIHEIMMNVLLESGRYKGSAAVKQSAFGIAPISVFGGAVKVKDEVKVDFDIVLTSP
jgi:polyisoprenoid-binding protein YceI